PILYYNHLHKPTLTLYPYPTLFRSISEYVDRVGQNLVKHSDAKVPFHIKVVDTDEVNAFAFPGGYFYVNKGLILAAENEAELAGDRKSTRLNSSHVSISYAVFCLKI